MDSLISVLGVPGYAALTVTPASHAPRAMASLPSMIFFSAIRSSVSCCGHAAIFFYPSCPGTQGRNLSTRNRRAKCAAVCRHQCKIIGQLSVVVNFIHSTKGSFSESFRTNSFSQSVPFSALSPVDHNSPLIPNDDIFSTRFQTKSPWFSYSSAQVSVA